MSGCPSCPFAATIEKLDAKPGDTLVVRVQGHPAAYDVRTWSEQMLKLVPAGVKVAILGPDVSLDVLRSSEGG